MAPRCSFENRRRIFVMDMLIDAGLSRQYLTHKLIESGLWSESGDNSRYGYTLSPCVYGIGPDFARNLEYLGRDVHRSLRSLDEKLICLGSGGVHLTKPAARFLRLAKTGTKNLLTPRDGGVGISPVIKVDLVQDMDGNYRIAEVDAYNPRGLGYLCLLASMTDGMKRFPGEGVLTSLFASIRRDNSPWVIIVSEYERYYEPAFGVLVKSLQKYGIPAKLVREEKLGQDGVDEVLGDFAQVLCIPESLSEYPKVRRRLIERYKEGSLFAIFPPKAYLGSKGFLPYLSGPGLAEEHIPKTSLVSRVDDPGAVIKDGTPAVLKATVSSGMKQVLFSDLDEEAFCAKLAGARKDEYPLWVMQEQVPQTATPVMVYDDCGRKVCRDYYFRIIAHITEYGILDVEVTGRPDRKVHGAPDCIQLPSVLL
jgi:hypothetical protein